MESWKSFSARMNDYIDHVRPSTKILTFTHIFHHLVRIFSLLERECLLVPLDFENFEVDSVGVHLLLIRSDLYDAYRRHPKGKAQSDSTHLMRTGQNHLLSQPSEPLKAALAVLCGRHADVGELENAIDLTAEIGSHFLRRRLDHGLHGKLDFVRHLRRSVLNARHVLVCCFEGIVAVADPASKEQRQNLQKIE